MILQKEQLERTVKYMEEATNIAILTGAGISTESGIPDFRSTNGLWTNNMSREEMISVRFLQSQPKRFWQAYKEIFQLKLMNNFKPNKRHQSLVELEQMGKNVTIITQNVDGLHSAAGSSRVLEVHGSIQHATCPKCGTDYDLSYINAHDFPQCNHVIEKNNICNHYIPVHHDDVISCEKCGTVHELSGTESAIRCKGKITQTISCTHYLKPGVVLFGDMVKQYDESIRAIEAADLLLVLGSSLQVGPVNQLPLYAHKNTKKIIINKEATDFDSIFDEVIHHSIGDYFTKMKKITEQQ